jgi:hypothetical protein
MFAVLVPGGVAMLAIRWLLVQEQIVAASWPDTILDWASFIVGSFIIGYLAHPPSHVLNKLYNQTYRRWKRRKGDPLLAWARNAAGSDVGPDDSIYAWAKSELSSRSNEQASKVELIEGVSKMFRTLTLLLLVAAVGAGVLGNLHVCLVLVLLALCSFLVFSERRFSATKETYQRLKRIWGDDKSRIILS